MSRRTAREVAMKLAFARMFGGEDTYEEILEQSGITETPKQEDIDFSNELLKGVADNEDKIDSIIGELSIGWEIQRISKVELCILRISIFEILYCDCISDSVSINEAVELAKRFGDISSSSFVNGILGTLSRKKTAEDQ